MTIKRCTSCHKYIDGAPDPSLVHVGKFGPECTASHHPDPCDHSGKDGFCQFYADQTKVEQLTAKQMQARDEVRQAELNRMSSELVSLKQNQHGGMEKMSSDILELKKMILDLRPPPPQGGSLAPQPQHSANVVPSTTQVDPVLSMAGAVGGVASQSSLLSDVQKHIQLNTVPPPSSQSRGGYTGPLMSDLRKDEGVTQVAQQVLAMLEQNIPQIRQHFAPLPGIASVATGTVSSSSLVSPPCVTAALQSGPIASVIPPKPAPTVMMSAHPAYNALLTGMQGTASLPPAVVPGASSDSMDAAQIMQLCTVSNRRQLRPHEFARLGRFSYASKITDKNITVPLFVMGYLQHVVALLRGVVPTESDTEVVDRLMNLMTIMEITANNSTLEDFKSPGWSIGLEYAGRIFHDIEYGRVKWEDLSEGLQPNTFLYAKDTVEMQMGKGGRGNRGDQQAARGVGGGRGRGGRGGGGGRSDSNYEGKKVCQSYNSFWTGTGCAYEYNNNRKCGYEHFCSTCFEKNGSKENHKAYYCQGENKSGIAAAGSVVTAKPAVTSG